MTDGLIKWQNVRVSVTSKRSFPEWVCRRCGNTQSSPIRCLRCDGKTDMRTVVEERTFISSHGFIDPLFLRDAFGLPSQDTTVVHPTDVVLRHSEAQEVRRTDERTRSDVTQMGDHHRTDPRTGTNRVDILVMTTLGKEFRAVEGESRVSWSPSRDQQTGLLYHRGRLTNGLVIALAGSTNMGPVSAALATSSAITALHPNRVVLTGIAAGIGDDVRLGDIVVSDQIVDYDAGKVKDGKHSPRYRAYQADPTLTRSARSFSTAGMLFSRELLNKHPMPGELHLPEIHVGTILAGSKVIADAGMVDELRNNWAQAVGLEMEGGGGAAAAHEHPSRPGFIVIKGVCDRADVAKDDRWQEWAALMAAKFAIDLLESLGTKDAHELQKSVSEPPPPSGNHTETAH